MMDGSHSENPPPLAISDSSEFEDISLNDHRKSFHNEDASGDQKDERLMHHDGDGAEDAP